MSATSQDETTKQQLKPRHYSRFWVKALDVSNTVLWRLSGGRLGSSVGPFGIMMLTTVGRKSGQRRTHPLTFIRDGANYVVIASNGGNVQHPGWYFNLQANPIVEVEYKGKREQRRAHTAGPEERARLWATVYKLWKGYAEYQVGLEGIRELPVIVLEPMS